MSYISVDVEADGPFPGKEGYSMVSFGMVLVDDTLTKTFYREVAPISNIWIPDALNVSGFSREEHEQFMLPIKAMQEADQWLQENSTNRPIFISDNPSFDWQWINYYFHSYLGKNPFGHSGRRIGDLYCGMVMDSRKNQDWKRKLRKTKHSHNSLDDAMGNAEAIIGLRDMGLKINLV